MNSRVAEQFPSGPGDPSPPGRRSSRNHGCTVAKNSGLEFSMEESIEPGEKHESISYRPYRVLFGCTRSWQRGAPEWVAEREAPSYDFLGQASGPRIVRSLMPPLDVVGEVRTEERVRVIHTPSINVVTSPPVNKKKTSLSHDFFRRVGWGGEQGNYPLNWPGRQRNAEKVS
jgi:hypothetical protein